jgi:hypothetical protein
MWFVTEIYYICDIILNLIKWKKKTKLLKKS